ncbi:MAG: T9SS type A sorting domain-containing protein [Ferruginibacter sp.]
MKTYQMLKNYVLLLLAFLFAGAATAQNVTVAGSTGDDGTYATLAAAFTAITTGAAQTGNNIVITITGNTTEPAGTGAVLVGGAWASINIRPGGGAARTITGNLTASTGLINFNGADNVTIDGLNTGGNSLTITNTRVNNGAGTSTIRILADATNNTITNCTILGSSTGTLTTATGTILFSTSTTNGNDNNTISNNNIGPAGTNLPTKAIMALGSTNNNGRRNSGILINNNNIYDFFSATVSVSGIYLSSGNDDWTISNNRIYQTAARNFTTATLRYAGITLNTATLPGVFTVTGNTIGFAAADGTGTTTITGSSNEFRGIDAIDVNTTTPTSIQGNIISGISQTTSRNSTTTTSAGFIALMLGSTDGIFNVGNTTGNNIGSLDGSSTIVVNATSTTTNTAPVYGIYDFSLDANNISNNNIGSITINNGGSGTTVGFRGILINTATGLTATVNNNTIGGNAAGSITNNIVGNYAMYGIQIASSNVSMTGNTIRNMSGNANGTSVIGMSGILTTGSTGINTISQNTIHSLDNNAGTANNSIYAMYCGFAAVANIVERNFIHSLSVTSTNTTSQIWGIYIPSGNATYRNNMIRLGLRSDGTSITSGFSIYGIYETAGTNNFYYNSVYIGGTGVASVANTIAFVSAVVNNTRNYRNNVFYNARSNASGGIANIAIWVGGTVPNPTGLTSNYNDLIADGVDGNVGVFNGFLVPTLAAWQTATGQDANSLNIDPGFINPAGTAVTGNLHISPYTLINSAGTNIVGITNDFDNDTRLVTPDIGADEVPTPLNDAGVTDFVAVCAAGLQNVQAVIKNYALNTLNTVSVAWTVNGVPQPNANLTGLGLASGASTTVTIGTYNFTANTLYTIVASTLLPNAAADEFIYNDTDSTSFYPGLGGTYTVGAAGNFTTLTAAINAYNISCINSAVVFELLDATYAEAGPMTINANTYSSAVNTLTIRPATGVTAAVSANAANAAVLTILDKYTIIDGSNNGSTSRDLTISNTSVTAPSVLLIGSGGITPITNVTVQNSILINGVNTSSALVISDGAAIGTAGYFNNITIQNNSIQRAFIGMYSNAVVAAGNGSGLLIQNNSLNTSGANAIRLVGIYVQGVDGATVSGNDIGNFESATGEIDRGIWFATGTGNSVIANNNIHDIRYTGTAGYAGKAVSISTGLAAANISVHNNMIYGITGDGDSYATYGALYCPVGIYAFGAGQGGIDIYYNSIHLTGAVLNLAGSYSIGIALDNDVSANIKNNIVYNQLGLLGGIGTGAAGIAVQTGVGQFTSLDYNDYVSAATLGTNSIGKIGATDYGTLAAWQAATGAEANSLNVIPVFVSATNLHLDSASNCQLDGYGTPIAGITTDIDAATRDLIAPDMGADEFASNSGGGLAGVASSAICQTRLIGSTGTTYVTAACGKIARLIPTGGTPVSGVVNVCVTLDATQQYFYAEPYVQRHFDFEPVTSGPTTTATATLYFTDAEFALYNTNNTPWPKLPTIAGGGNADPFIANVKVTQFHGSPTGGLPTSTPGNYPGAKVLLTPTSVVLNGTVWEVTVSFTGFSGFYVHTKLANSPLPISINYFNGRKQGGNHLLDWKVSCNSTPRATMILERSANGSNYTAINNITADAARCDQPFNYTDASPLPGYNYYRLKMIDADGKVSYSSVVILLNAVKGFEIISIAPNPVVDNIFKLNITSTHAGKMELSIFDMQGRIVNRQALQLTAGFSSLPVNVSGLSAGTYTLYGLIDGDKSKVIRFVKQ